MRRVWPAVMSSVLLGSFAGAADRPAPAVALGDFKELLKLPKDQLPLGMGLYSCPFIQVSPDGKRYIRICVQKDFYAIPYLGLVGVPKSDEPVPWDKRGVLDQYCRLTFAGNAWRADSKRVLFLHPISREDGTGWVEHYERTMFPYAMCWDLANPQCTRPRHMSLKDKGETGCTAASYSPDGKLLYTAYSDPEGFKSCGITETPQGRPRSRILYRMDGRAVNNLVPSPDGKHLAWVETYPRKDPKKRRGADVVILDLETRKVVQRIGLSRHVFHWPDAQPPVWTVNSKALCYGDVLNIDKVYGREVRLFDLAKAKSRTLLRDAVAVGATSGGIVLNRGPSCVPSRQSLSSYLPPPALDDRPKTNEIALCGLTGKEEPQVLASNAHAQQVLGDTLIYAQRSGEHVIVMRARLKLVMPPIAPTSRKSSAP